MFSRACRMDLEMRVLDRNRMDFLCGMKRRIVITEKKKQSVIARGKKKVAGDIATSGLGKKVKAK